MTHCSDGSATGTSLSPSKLNSGVDVVVSFESVEADFSGVLLADTGSHEALRGTGRSGLVLSGVGTAAICLKAVSDKECPSLGPKMNCCCLGGDGGCGAEGCDKSWLRRGPAAARGDGGGIGREGFNLCLSN